MAAATLTDKQRATLKRVAREHASGRWARATGAGERVTLASLFDRGLLARRAWRGDGVSRDSAFEYRPGDELLEALTAARARKGLG